MSRQLRIGRASVGDLPETACGTGIWIRHLLTYTRSVTATTRSVTATDATAKMIAALQRIPPGL